ncbi:RING finger protein nhl-1-like isoform X2 [Argiope bruennichi]|uniref:RING finger protein nhl-1-like isoform X2 n=1 Tax=Argiope bruennichi TaxID=94029 RepID=UPI00249461F3|nr:RING finger protein nhl-1-like isoform X2 [Argiope bruennichi]
MASAWSQLDQLLTCAICLDRYRNPKLLPCQHTFCMEPCLDGLIDYARRQIKCPECRAEHRIPYQGIQQFPTNVTLMRFLELHRDITGEEPEPPPSCMERCSVCSEKANVEKCAHCDKKICPDCKEAHVDILRREINRINNQVRRGLHKLSEALSQTKKNAEKLQLNCKQVKDEIDDIVRRYSKDLKVTEDKLKHDLETYTQTEMKAISKLKEDLEIEVNNISSNCELVDKYIKDDYEWSDLELLEYKQIFLKMLDFLRTYDVDNTDFTRRIKFQPRADPDVLHRNIADFGELKINAPMNPVPTQQSLMPNSNALMRSQSDHRLAAQFARRCDNRSFSDINQRMDNDRDSGRPTSPLLGRNRRDNDGYRRYSERSRDYDYQDRVSNRYSREDTALSSRWRDNSDDYGHRNRYPRDYEEPDSEPHQGRTVRFADENQQQRERIFDLDDASKGPLSGVVKLLDSPKVQERLHQNEVKQKLQQSDKDKQPSTPTVTPTAPVTPPVTQPKRPTSRQQSEDDIDRQKRANQQASSSTTPTSQTDSVVSSRRSSTADSTRVPATVDTTEPPQVPEVVESSENTSSRGRLSGTTSFDDSTVEPPRIQSRQVSNTDLELDSKDTEVGNSKDLVGLRDTKTPRRHTYTRHQSDTRYDRPTSILSDEGSKQDTNRCSPNFLSNSRPSTPTRRLTLDITGQERPNYNRYRSTDLTRVSSPIEDARSPTSRYSPLCRRSFLPTISSLEPTSNDDSCCSSDSSANVFFSCNSSLEDISTQSQGFSRSPLVKATSLDAGETSRKPLDKKLPPRAATPVHHNDEEDSEESEESEEEETYQPAPEPPKPVQSSFFSRQRRLPEPEPRLLEMHETDEEEESESEEESEDEDDEEETPPQAPSSTIPNEPKANSGSDSEEEDDEEEASSESSSTESEESKESADPVFENTTNSQGTGAGKQSSTLAQNNENANSKTQLSDSDEEDSDDPVEAEGKVSDDEDAEEEYKHANDSTKRRPSIDQSGTRGHRSRKRSDDTDTTDSSSASSSTNYHSLSRTTTPLVTSNASEDQISSERSGNETSASRFRRRPFLARSKSSHELGLGFDSNSGVEDEDEQSPDSVPSYRTRSQRVSEDTPRTRSSTTDSPVSNSNTCWAKYLNSKYGSNAAGRVVPRSRSSHSLFHKSDSESSDEEPSGRDPVLSNSYGFSNPRSNYMQKRRMLLKIGSRGSESGQFTWPRGVAVGPENSIVVADSSNHRIQVFDSIGKFLFEFGTYGSGEGEFDCLAGVSVNRIGQFIVSDRYNNRIQLFDPTGRFLRAFGCEGRTDGRFSYPWGIATDSLGFIYVCDKENHRIQVFQSDGTFVGKFGSMGSRPGQLEHPHYIAVTNTNRVVVSDTNNHRVQIFDVNGRSLTTFGSEGSDEGQFKFPKGVAVDDQGYIIVGDGGNNRVQIFQPDGTFLKSFGGWGSGDGEFKGLEGLAVTSGGSVIVCDRENHRIQVF